jgi:hypothetical protein
VRYQQLLLMLTAGPQGQFPRWRSSRKRHSVCSVLRCATSSKLCTKLTLQCNHRSGHLKTEHTESLFMLRCHLGNWPRGKHEKRTAGSARCTLCQRKERNKFLVNF